ncbi:DnaJ-domain-containing protein [Sporormia fimetaria CBS 119925]|uniref:DnaJ-domain-containing protein n=1 Tax=Sporormia fimetaria CBS 119925 TaxID=1340428 RepID=A0A6A6V273_9PLEO|nr:DnaJ-domain-containing protein [Sporormia fimetaria CBS 119925]
MPAEEPVRRDYYADLGVDQSASSAQITSAYRKLALQCHPDKVRDEAKAEAAEKFKKAQPRTFCWMRRSAQSMTKNTSLFSSNGRGIISALRSMNGPSKYVNGRSSNVNNMRSNSISRPNRDVNRRSENVKRRENIGSAYSRHKTTRGAERKRDRKNQLGVSVKRKPNVERQGEDARTKQGVRMK